MFNINDIVTDAPDAAPLIHGISRILAVSPDRTQVALIRLDKLPIPAPYSLNLESVQSASNHRLLKRLDVFDTGYATTVDGLSDYQLKQMQKTMAALASLTDDEFALFNSNHRALALKLHAKAAGLSSRHVRRLYYRYLRGGMTPTAMAGPEKGNSTGRKQAPGTARRGRKPKPDSPSLSLGEIRQQLEAAAKRFYKPGKTTIKQAFDHMLDTYFIKGKRSVRTTEGVIFTPIRFPATQQPSRHQFRRICSHIRKTLGIYAYPTRRQTADKRGRATQDLSGPGERFEIDATKLQVRILSRYNRARRIGTATLYIVIDTWSDAIVGYALSLENPSWPLAARALRNCFTDKGEVFKRLGLRHTSKDWPAKHLPHRLTADRGELIGEKAGVIPNTSIKLEIMKPYNPQGKGSVEGTFNQVKNGNNSIKIPGKFRKLLTRGTNDGRKDAALTLLELECIIVEIILLLNRCPASKRNIPPEASRAGPDAITRIGLFEWGLTHRAGHTRTLTPQEVYTTLLTPATASMTSDGILFKKQVYFDPILSELGFIARATRDGHYKLNIRYDEYIGEEIWFLDPRTASWRPIRNENPDVARLKVSFWELEDHDKALNDLVAQAETTQHRAARASASRLNKSTNVAVRKAKQAKAKGQPKDSDVRENTARERQAERMIYERDVAAALGRDLSSAGTPSVRGDNSDDEYNIHHRLEEAANASETALDLWRLQR